MSDSKKTKKELIEELKALRVKADTGAAQTEAGSGDDSNDQSGGLTRRDVLTAWVAPVILTVPLAPRMARAQAQGVDQGVATVTGSPTVNPTTAEPTVNPTTSQPTFNPTAGPTPPTAVPTPKPTQVPTPKPTMVPTGAPTASPTSFPTVSPTTVIPVELSEFEIE